MNDQNLIVNISVTRKGWPLEDFAELRQEVEGLLLSINARVLQSPMDVKDADHLFATFEIPASLRSLVESMLFDGIRINDFQNATVSFDEINPDIETL